MKDYFSKNQKNNYNKLNEPNLSNNHFKKTIKNLDNNISYSDSDESKSEEKSETNIILNKDNSYDSYEEEEFSQDKENEKNTQKYNINNNIIIQNDNNNNLNKNRIEKKSLNINININYNKTNLNQMNYKQYKEYHSEKKDSGYSNFFLKDKRALSGEKNFRAIDLFNSNKESYDNPLFSQNTYRYNNINKKNKKLQSNYAPTYLNSKVEKIKKVPKDEINFNKNLNYDFYLRNNDYNTVNTYNIIRTYKASQITNNTSSNLIDKQHITKVKKLPSKKIPLNINSNFNDNYSNNINNIKEEVLNINELKKENELSEENNEIYNLSSRNQFTSENLNNEYIHKSNKNDIKPRLTNPIQNNSNLYSLDNSDNNNERKSGNEYLKENEGYQDLISKNNEILNRTPALFTQIRNLPINFDMALKQPQINNNELERKTFVKKLSPIDNNNNDDKNNLLTTIRQNEEMNINKKNNEFSMNPNRNNLRLNEINNKTFKNQENINIKRLEKRVIPIQNDMIPRPSYNQINNISKNKKIIKSQDNQNQMFDMENINEDYISENKPLNILINQYPKKKFQSDYMDNQHDKINIQGNLNLNHDSEEISFNEKENNYYSNNLNQFLNANGKINQKTKSKLNNMDSINNKEDFQEKELKEDIEKKEGDSTNNEKKNNINISYNNFDGSGWIKNYGGVSLPGKDITGRHKINQDSIVSFTNINNIKDFNIFGVLDGHGPEGHYVSQFSAKYIPSQIINNPQIKNISDPDKIYEILKNNKCHIIMEAFLSCDEKLKNVAFNAYNSGTTCNLVIHIGNHIICAYTGDSRAIVAYNDQQDLELNNLESAQLSIDFKPNIPEEEKRILMSGGTVRKMKNEYGIDIGPYRVYVQGEKFPGLAMSRSIGDLNSKSIGIIVDPGISEYNLNNSTKFIVIASDGVWDYLSNEIVKDIGKSYYLEDNPSQFCHQLINNSVIQWQKNDIVIDDITVVVIFF